MAEFPAVTDDEITAWLDREWAKALDRDAAEADPDVDRLVDSDVVSIRYAVVTQLLGKVADPARDLLCLQRGVAEGAEDAGRWDPRSFCIAVVVPWVRRNRDVLGSSGDPYVNNPLRRPRLDGDERVQRRTEWDALRDFLQELERAEDHAVVLDAVRRCLRSAVRRLGKLTIEYPVPLRLALDHLTNLLDSFLNQPSNGLRPLVVTTALMGTLGKAFGLFPRVESQGLNEPDAATGMPADVMCYGPAGDLRLAVEVKDRDLTLVDIDATLAKARRNALANVMFTAPGVRQQDEAEVRARVTDEWAMGTNVYRVTIGDIVRSTFALLGEEWRVRFARAIGAELDRRVAEHRHRRDWSDLLTNT